MDKWPSLPYENWKDTLDTLHLWTQIVGKIKLRHSLFINQWWEVALYITSRGLTTGRIPYMERAFDISFDFLTHKCTILTSDGKEKTIILKPRTVADFYKELINSLKELGINIKINTLPSEIKNAIPFDKDTNHKSYDKKSVEKWHQIQLQISFIFDKFRRNFRGKNSPVQFFWGGFDLSGTRFSGKKVKVKDTWPKGYAFMKYAENEENFAYGFWPGDENFPYPAFYSYLNPAPKGQEKISYFNTELSECVLPYERVRKTKNPEKEILNFLETTYNEYAKLAKWNIKELKGITPKL